MGKRRVYRIRGKVVSKAKYQEQMKALHASKHQGKGSGKKRFAEAKRKNDKRKQRWRKVDYQKTHAKTIDVSNDKISQDDLDTFKKWKKSQGSGDVIGLDTPLFKKKGQIVAEAEEERLQEYPTITNYKLFKEYENTIQTANKRPTESFNIIQLAQNKIRADHNNGKLTDFEKDALLSQGDKKRKQLEKDKDFSATRQFLISKGLAKAQDKKTKAQQEKEIKIDEAKSKMNAKDTLAGKLDIKNPTHALVMNKLGGRELTKNTKTDNQILLAILVKRKNQLESQEQSELRDVKINRLERTIKGVESEFKIKAMKLSMLANYDLSARYDFVSQDIQSKKKAKRLIKVSKDDIRKDLAESAFNGTSLTPDKRGESARQQYVDHMNGFQEELFDKVPKKDHAKLKVELKQYQEKYLNKYTEQLGRHSGIASTFVTGGSKFPARQMKKKNEVYDRKQQELWDWDEKVRKRIKGKFGLGANSHHIKSDDKDAISKIDKKIEAVTKRHQFMKDVNKVVRSKKLSEKEKVEKLQADFKLKSSSAREILKPDFAGRKGFPSYELTSNTSEIRRLKGRKTELTTLRNQETKQETVRGVKVKDNVEANRLQLIFDGKPTEKVRKELKSLGFRFSYKNEAWQRQRGSTANENAKRFLANYRKSDEIIAKPSLNYNGKTKAFVLDERQEEKFRDNLRYGKGVDYWKDQKHIIKLENGKQYTVERRYNNIFLYNLTWKERKVAEGFPKKFVASEKKVSTKKEFIEVLEKANLIPN